jgi:drug/metabolite transporter (DMT)-like permease
MLHNRTVLIGLTIPFALVTTYAVVQVGYTGIVAYHLPNPAGWQVFFDLCVALILVLSWMIADARQHRRTVWPYVVATLLLGSFGPLAYLIASRREENARPGSGVG